MSTHREFCLTRAAELRAEAANASLENVRDRCLRAAKAWDAMAERANRTETMRAQQAAAKEAAALEAK